MSKLLAEEQEYIKKLFFKGARVLDFDAEQFHDFVYSIVKIPVLNLFQTYDTQKAFEKLLRITESKVVIKLVKEMLGYARAKNKHFEVVNSDVVQKVKEIINKYSNQEDLYKLPSINKEGLGILEKDINRTLADHDYILAIDRLHTYSLYFFEDLCKKNNLTPNKDKKGHMMFDDMISQLQKKFDEHGVLNDFDKEAIKNSKEIFNKYNGIRNNGSYAHPNQIIENARAKYLINNIIILLNYFLVLNEQIQK